MTRLFGVVGVLTVVVGAMAFATLNGSARVTLELGFTTLYRIPVVYVAFGGFLSGMLVMLMAGIRSDLKVRQILRERLLEEDMEERARVDRYQRDLFKPDED